MSIMLLAAAAAALPVPVLERSPAMERWAVTGRWAVPQRHGVVEITSCGPSICGRLVDSDGLRADPQLRDIHNQDAGQQARPLRDLLMLQGFTRGDKGWDGGLIYNADDGGTYKATITTIDANTLKLRGCIVWPLCKTQIWTRIR